MRPRAVLRVEQEAFQGFKLDVDSQPIVAVGCPRTCLLKVKGQRMSEV